VGATKPTAEEQQAMDSSAIAWRTHRLLHESCRQSECDRPSCTVNNVQPGMIDTTNCLKTTLNQSFLNASGGKMFSSFSQ